MTSPEEIFSGQVQDLAFGGQGIVRHEGFVIFVPFTAPGDSIRFRITHKKKNFAQGELVEVLQASPERAPPRCPYFGTCGGCQLQHITYEAQLKYKQQSIQDALHRIGSLPNALVLPVVAAQQRWNYRRRVLFNLRPYKGHYTAGYLATDNHSLVVVEQCPIFIPQEEPLIARVQQIVSKLENRHEQAGKLMLLKEDHGRFLLHFQFESLPSNAVEILEKSLAEVPSCSGILATSRNEQYVFGIVDPQLVIDGLTFSFSPQAFIQNHPEQSLNIYHSIVTHAKNLNAQKILDLYCGIGISSLLLTNQGLTVIGVESNKEAIKRAQSNALVNKLEKKARFIQADVQHILKNLLKQEHPELVIVNPPRTGLDTKVIQTLLVQAPQSILYISCMPSTLARDLKFFCGNGYKLLPVEAYDMFPQTAHVEILALLTRGNVRVLSTSISLSETSIFLL